MWCNVNGRTTQNAHKEMPENIITENLASFANSETQTTLKESLSMDQCTPIKKTFEYSENYNEISDFAISPNKKSRLQKNSDFEKADN